MKRLILGFAIIFTITSCKSEVKKEKNAENSEAERTKEQKQETQTLFIELSPKNNSKVIGKAKFEETNGVVVMTVVVNGLSEGMHAIHIHEKSDCSSDDGKSAGGHWNPTAKPHGKWGAKTGYHKGDIGNFNVNKSDGDTEVEFKSDEWCIGCGDPTKDILGKAIIIHQGEDDYTSQPSGAAGSRVSCGGIIK
jgi:Cu-Zn family superoxide dismutase|tara:strand:- start:2557 stop:3135 length:579 start_codon:yes stop_codon:yes gene_type:complete